MNILVSACLLGANCRYDGASSPNEDAIYLRDCGHHLVIPVCPEILGGLPVPREPAEICDGRVICADGTDVTDAFVHGAQSAVALAKAHGCTLAVLRQGSPSCGCGLIADGTFSGEKIEGAGITAQALQDARVRIIADSDLAREVAHLR